MATVLQTEVPAPGAPAAPPRMTYEEFLDWAGEDTLAEWVDGEVVFLSPAGNAHQDIAGFLTSTLRIYVEHGHLGIVRSAPFQMKLERGREPDLLFLAEEHKDRLTPGHLAGPADMVVEVMSTEPSDRARDRGEKYFEYERGGVREYWLIDPDRRKAEFYCLDDRGVYQLVPVGEDGIFRSRVIEGLWLRVGWLWQTPLPGVLEVLAEWGII